MTPLCHSFYWGVEATFDSFDYSAEPNGLYEWQQFSLALCMLFKTCNSSVPSVNSVSSLHISHFLYCCPLISLWKYFGLKKQIYITDYLKEAVYIGYGKSGTGSPFCKQVKRHLGPTMVHLYLIKCSKPTPSNGSTTKTSWNLQ